MFCCRAKSDDDVTSSNDIDNVIIDVTNASLSNDASLAPGSGKDELNGVATTGKVGVGWIVMVLCLVITSLWLCSGGYHWLKDAVDSLTEQQNDDRDLDSNDDAVMKLEVVEFDEKTGFVRLIVKNLPYGDRKRDYHWRVKDHSGYGTPIENLNNPTYTVLLSDAVFYLQNGYTLHLCYPTDKQKKLNQSEWTDCYHSRSNKLEIPDHFKGAVNALMNNDYTMMMDHDDGDNMMMMMDHDDEDNAVRNALPQMDTSLV
eukprot:76297_1